MEQGQTNQLTTSEKWIDFKLCWAKKIEKPALPKEDLQSLVEVEVVVVVVVGVVVVVVVVVVVK